jgi:hypothetical protein
VEAICAMRRFDFFGAVSIVWEAGDFSRFTNPRPLMGERK